jgi:Phage P22-like portal protein
MNEAIEVTAKPLHDPDIRYGAKKGLKKAKSAETFNTEEEKRKHQRLYDWWMQAKEQQSVNRYQQSIDADFKDGLQWTDEDARVLMDRGQAPVVYNKIKPAIDWILGTEKRTRIDFNVFPRKKDNTKEAESKKNLLKYLSDVNKTVFARSRAFDDAVTVGIGWLEDSIRGDETKELLQTKYESWRNIWYDHTSVEKDMSDARYLFRSKLFDLDIACAIFPQGKFVLEQEADKLNSFSSSPQEEWGDDYFYSARFEGIDSVQHGFNRRQFTSDALVNNRRQRVRLIECWYREPISKKIIRGGDFAGEYFDENNQNHVQQVTEEYASLSDTLVMQMRCAIMTESHLLQDMESPYLHNDFPLTPIIGYRRSRDNAPYGAVRNIRDPQESLNKRASKALHILSTEKIIAEEDAATDWDNVKDEAARPDGVILLDGRKGARFELVNDKALAQQHLNLMDIDAKMIQDVSGITDENMGRDTNATSGKAITARQEQGAIVVAELFDNLRYAVQLQGEKQLALIEQYYDEEKIIRVTGQRGKVEFMPINQPAFDEQSGQWVLMNPMTTSKANFVVDEQDYQASMRQAMFETMNELMRTLPPEVSLQLLDLVYDNSDLPGREEIVQRIRKINGQEDPNIEETPEVIAQREAKQAAEQEAQAIEKERIQLELNKLKAEIDKIKADAVSRSVEGLYSGMTAANLAATVPAVLPIADQIMSSAGFIDANGGQIATQPSMPVQTTQMPENTNPITPPNPDVGLNQGIENGNI